MGATRVHAKACIAFFLCAAGLAHAATPPNTSIVNTATASFSISGVAIPVSGAATIVTSASTPASVQLLGYAATTNGLPAGYATRQPVAATQCDKAGAGLSLLPAPIAPGAGAMTVPGNYLLAPTNTYATGDAVFIQVTDFDQNLNPALPDTLAVTVQVTNGDSETLRLTETGPSTGVFTGYLQTANVAVQAGNCVLSAGSNQRITVTYFDDSEGHVAVSAAALIDPMGVVFDASTGQPVDGAKVTVINMATGKPAQVFGNDGTSSYPSSVLSGSTVTDGSGASYAFTTGRYQFPRMAPGSYSFVVEPPAGLRFPSKAQDVAIKALAGGPYQLAPGSRGEAFTLVPGPAVEIDIPLDPGPLGEVAITKTAGKAVAAIGDFVPYTLAIANRGAYALPGVQIADRLPAGFRYQAGSARLDEAVLADPKVSADGRSLLFSLGTLAASGAVSVRYVTVVAAGAQPGQAENVAQSAGRISSNVAKAYVQVREDLNQSRAILAGRVTVAESCEADARDTAKVKPLANVRVLLEDGTFLLTDVDGNWHADNIRPGTHVVQVDTTTLPQGVELKNCESTTRTGGRDFSQFVNVRGGTLWRADFRLVRAPSCLRQQFQRDGQRSRLQLSAPVASQSLSATVMLPAGAKVVPGSISLDGQALSGVEQQDDFLVLRLPAQRAHWNHVFSFETVAPAGELKASVRVQPLGQAALSLQPLVLGAQASEAAQCSPLPLGALAAAPAADAATAPPAGREGGAPLVLIEKLPYDDKWLAAAPPGNEWLHPKVGFAPALPVIKVAVKHAKGAQVDLKVNGNPVDPLRYEGSILSPTGQWAISNWRAVDLRDGANTLDVLVKDALGAVLLQESRVIHYSSAPAKVVLDLQRSRLVADGRTPPVIAVRMLDGEGQPVRRGLTGDFQLNTPFLPQQQADALQREPLAGNLGGQPKFQVSEDGLALIPLQPTTQTGEAVLRFDFPGQRTQEVRAWLSADLREWILVGFAEGSLVHKKLSGNLEALKDAGADERLSDGNRVAFYAKGQVKGEYLLTAAYDSAKSRGTAPGASLKQAIDPNQYYTLYADGTQAQFDAASTSKLYLKIEKKQFYALFGDFDTGLTVSELGRYSRTLTGLKSEYKGERVGYNAFAARTSQNFMRDEVQGDGTSGLYRLRARNILLNSEKIRIEVRDRFHPDQVVSTRSLTPYLDYQLDPAQGTLFFREPIPSRDTNLNPILVVAEYETDDKAGESWTYGGRAALKLGEKSEVGATHIHEGTGGREARLTGVDATVQIGETTKIRAEAATSERNTATGSEKGNAWLAEVTHDDGKVAARAYASQQQPGFGLGQQAAASAGQRSVGAEGRLKLSDQLQVSGTTYRQDNLVSGGRRDVAEAQAEWTAKEGLTLRGGVRAANERDGSGGESEARQVTGGVSYEMMERRLILRATTDLDVGSKGSGTVNFPNRLVLGADYKLTPETTLVATQEFARGDEVKANTTRIGLRSTLWQGAEVNLGGGAQGTLDASRLYANMGLVQKLQISDRWSADASVDRVQTLKTTANPLGPAQPPASGTATAAGAAYGLVTGDYTAVSAGLAYHDDVWSANARAEWRGADDDTKVNLLLGAQRKLAQGRVMAAGLAVTSQHGLTDTRNIAARLSFASRPADSSWMWLEKFEYVEDSNTSSLASRLLTRKLISNFNANWKATRDTQVALQYSAKYVREMIGDTSYSGYTDLFGIEARHDIAERWDVGLHASTLHSYRTGTRQTQMGVSVGYRLADNTWMAVGYNQMGFTDADFSGSEYRGKGLYVSLRVKVDQDTFDLNDRAKSQLPVKP
jgi:uncharacterized repeat protein (TIGR01451 family)